jgi:hypothetical protein
MSKQTAIIWFNQQLIERQNGNGDRRSWSEILREALLMEREQIVEAFKIGSDKGYDCALDYITHEECDEQNYYNETYGGQDE